MGLICALILYFDFLGILALLESGSIGLPSLSTKELLLELSLSESFLSSWVLFIRVRILYVKFLKFFIFL